MGKIGMSTVVYEYENEVRKRHHVYNYVNKKCCQDKNKIFCHR